MHVFPTGDDGELDVEARDPDRSRVLFFHTSFHMKKSWESKGTAKGKQGNKAILKADDSTLSLRPRPS